MAEVRRSGFDQPIQLHAGQGALIALGVGAAMLLAGADVLPGRLTVGDLVLVNAYVIQVCLPLNSLGFVTRETTDALTLCRSVVRAAAPADGSRSREAGRPAGADAGRLLGPPAPA